MSAVLFQAASNLDIISWAGHLVAVWVLGLTLGWLVSLYAKRMCLFLLLRDRNNRFVVG
jgi:hypothetical protein